MQVASIPVAMFRSRNVEARLRLVEVSLEVGPY
jgi:hypothetical protein